MFKHPRSTRRFIQAALAGSLALAFFPAFAADFPSGTYVVDGAKVTVMFDGKGQFEVQEDEKKVVAGTYTVKGSEVKFTDKEGPWACTKEGQQTGTYHWTYEKFVLTFTKVADACPDRARTVATKWRQAQSN